MEVSKMMQPPLKELRETEFIAGRKVPERPRKVHKQITNEAGKTTLGTSEQSSVYLDSGIFLGLIMSVVSVFYIYPVGFRCQLCNL